MSGINSELKTVEKRKKGQLFGTKKKEEHAIEKKKRGRPVGTKNKNGYNTRQKNKMNSDQAKLNTHIQTCDTQIQTDPLSLEQLKYFLNSNQHFKGIVIRRKILVSPAPPFMIRPLVHQNKKKAK